MSLTLTITDPHLLSDAERTAVLAFCQIKIADSERRRPPVPVVSTGVRNEQQATAAEPIIVREGPNTIRGEVRVDVIDPADNPETGRDPGETPALDDVKSSGAFDPAKAFGTLSPDAAAVVFGGGSATAPFVPEPPVPGTPDAPQVPVASAPAVGNVATPAASASATGAAAPPAPTNSLDSEGYPWDMRIHATTKTKNADGTWRAKRGVEESTVVAVRAELAKLMAIPAPSAAPPPPDGAPDVPPPPGMTFGDFVSEATRLQVLDVNPLTLEQINSCLPEGMATIVGLRTRLDLIPGVIERLRALQA